MLLSLMLGLQVCAQAKNQVKGLAPYCQLVKAKPCTEQQVLDLLRKELLLYKGLKNKKTFQQLASMHAALTEGVRKGTPFEKVMQGFQPREPKNVKEKVTARQSSPVTPKTPSKGPKRWRNN